MRATKQPKNSPGNPTTNALFISLDRNLLNPAEGDALSRHRRYAKYFNSLHVIVLTPRSEGPSSPYIDGNLSIVPTNSKSRWWYVIDALRLVRSILKEQLIDVISAQDPFVTALVGVIARSFTNCPLNIQVHNDFFSTGFWKNETLTNRSLYHLGKRLLARADSIRVVSRRIEDTVTPVLPSHIPIRVIPILPAPRFSQLTEKKSKTFDVIAVGRLVAQKNLKMLIHAATALKNSHPRLRIVVVGDGPLRKRLEELRDRLLLQNTVRFLGSRRPEQISKLLKRSKIFVLTSNYEGLSIAMVEAMLAGLPVVATTVSGTDELLKDGESGFRLSAGDSQGLANRIAELIEDDQMREAMGRRARRIAMRFVRTNREQAWVDFLNETVKRGKNWRIKQDNIRHYSFETDELGKSKRHASKVIYYPRIARWLGKYLRNGQRVVDVGGGAGRLMASVKRDKKVQVIGLDISHRMLLLRRRLGLITNLAADMDQMPLREACADAVVYIAALHHTLDTRRTLAESQRILKPGGKLLLIEHNSFRALFSPFRERPIPAPHDERETLINHYSIVRQMRSCGFQIIESQVIRQLPVIVEAIWNPIPLRMYRLLQAGDAIASKIPVVREIGSLMIIVGEK